MRRPTSLTLRLTLLFGMVAAIVFSGFGWFIERSIEHHFRMEDTAELDVIAHAVARVLYSQGIVDDPVALKQRYSDLLVGHHAAVLYVAGQDGRPLFASPGAAGLSIIATQPLTNDEPNDEQDNEQDSTAHSKQHLTHQSTQHVTQQWSNGEHTYRVLTRHIGTTSVANDDRYTISVAVAIDYHLRFLEGFHRTLWLMITSSILLMGMMGWVAVHQGHAPLHNIVAQIRRISANQLNTRLSPEMVPRELTDLAVSFNEMLERMEEAFQRLSNFSDDIAHELRTPVTSLLTQTQVVLTQSRTIDEYREILYSNIEEYERMAQMIGDMLFLAKAENGLYQPNNVDVDLAQEIQDLFEYYEAWAEERGVLLALEGSGTVPGDRLMLRRALSNLLSNAIRHTPAGNTVQVRLERASAQTVSVIVENPGPAIPAEHIPRLFDRFYRVDASRQRSGDGAGLGLAIVKSIIDIHGGKIEVNSIDQVTQFRMTLP